MTNKIKLGSVILIGVDPFDGKPTPEMEIFDAPSTAAMAILDNAVSYDAFEAIRLGEDGKWSSCWSLVEWYLGLAGK